MPKQEGNNFGFEVAGSGEIVADSKVEFLSSNSDSESTMVKKSYFRLSENYGAAAAERILRDYIRDTKLAGEYIAQQELDRFDVTLDSG